MEYIADEYYEFLYKGDEKIRTWFLVGSNYLPFLLSGLYILISTKIGPALMKNRQPFQLKTILIVFNFSLVVVYAVCLALYLWILQDADFALFCGDNEIIEGSLIYKVAVLAYVLYLVKYVEFLDTIFFILRKKNNQISILHITHHALLPLLCWLIARTETAALQSIPLFLNAFVHIVMYTYYGLAAMGPEVRKRLWWKKYITQLQITQFILVIILMTIVVPLTDCKIGIFTYVTNIMFVPLLLYLFYQFYKEEYELKKRNEAKMKLNHNKNGDGNHFFLSSNEMGDVKKVE